MKRVVLILGALLLPPGHSLRAQPDAAPSNLVGHWLAGDTKDHSGVKNHGVDLQATGPKGQAAGLFNGRDSFLEVPARPSWKLGKNDFTVAAWVQVPVNFKLR